MTDRIKESDRRRNVEGVTNLAFASKQEVDTGIAIFNRWAVRGGDLNGDPRLEEIWRKHFQDSIDLYNEVRRIVMRHASSSREWEESPRRK